MTSLTHLEVVRIPCNGSDMDLTTIPLIKIGHGGIRRDECNQFEKALGHIPNLKSFNSSKEFSWTYRKFSGLTNNDIGEEPWKADYMMYLCVDQRSGLPCNEYLKWLVKIGRGPLIPSKPFGVYGDAFVFRMESKSKESDEPNWARYINMDENFIDSATSRRREQGTWAFCMLRKLLVCPEQEA